MVLNKVVQKHLHYKCLFIGLSWKSFNLLSVPFSPYLSDATHTLYLKTNKQKGQGAQGRSETSVQGTNIHFLIVY